MRNNSQKLLAIGATGLLLGALVVLGIRFLTYHPKTIHYTANFAIYLNGQEQKFTNAAYYVDGGCTESPVMTPPMRAHLVEGIPDVVHVMDNAVTWGDFFNNLGWYTGPDFIETADGTMYYNHGQSELHIILNGQDYTGLGSVNDMAIKNRDRLLLSFGNESQSTVNAQYASVPKTAAKYDHMKTTSACGHNTKVTVKERLDNLF